MATGKNLRRSDLGAIILRLLLDLQSGHGEIADGSSVEVVETP